jgi:hypothetical protein
VAIFSASAWAALSVRGAGNGFSLTFSSLWDNGLFASAPNGETSCEICDGRKGLAIRAPSHAGQLAQIRKPYEKTGGFWDGLGPERIDIRD